MLRWSLSSRFRHGRPARRRAGWVPPRLEALESRLVFAAGLAPDVVLVPTSSRAGPTTSGPQISFVVQGQPTSPNHLVQGSGQAAPGFQEVAPVAAIPVLALDPADSLLALGKMPLASLQGLSWLPLRATSGRLDGGGDEDPGTTLSTDPGFWSPGLDDRAREYLERELLEHMQLLSSVQDLPDGKAALSADQGATAEAAAPVEGQVPENESANLALAAQGE